jgi:hypothetical protein
MAENGGPIKPAGEFQIFNASAGDFRPLVCG